MAADPHRTCLGCGKVKPQRELVRLALDKEGRLVVDPGRAHPGRGGYLCGPGCVEGAVKRKAWGRAFRTKVTVESEALAKALAEAVSAIATLTPGRGKH